MRDTEYCETQFARAERLSREIYFMSKERDQLRAENVRLAGELAVARERLGPAGYKILSEVATLRNERDQALAEAADLWNALQAVQEDGNQNCEGCDAKDRIAYQAIESASARSKALLDVVIAAREYLKEMDDHGGSSTGRIVSSLKALDSKEGA